MFGKDIDQFLENSEWDIESLDKVSQHSGASQGSKTGSRLKQMEQLYLNRLEAQGGSPGGQRQVRKSSSKGARQSKKGPERETIMQVSDDPGVIHRGEQLPFETKKTYKTKK